MDYSQDYEYSGYYHPLHPDDVYSISESVSLHSLPDLEYPYYHSETEWDPYYHPDMVPYSYWDVISASTSLPSLVDQQVYHVP